MIQGLQSRCWLSLRVHSSGDWGGGGEAIVQPPGNRGRALANIWEPAGQGWGSEGIRAFKRLPREVPQLLHLPAPDTSVTMWFLVLCLALSLGGTGETVGGCGRGNGP